MTSTASTICTAMEALLRHGCQPTLLVAATHALLRAETARSPAAAMRS